MTEQERDVLSKVPAVTLGFWIIKILATTLGETAGDTVTMSMKLGYLAGTGIFMTVLALLRPAGSIPSSTGRPSWPRPRRARPWPTSPPGRWASAIPAAPCCC